MSATTETRQEFAERLLADAWNDWDGSDTAEDIAAARFAVRVDREDDAWIRAADTVEQVAGIIAACYFDTEGYDEWPDSVYDVATGEPVQWAVRWTADVTVSGETVQVTL